MRHILSRHTPIAAHVSMVKANFVGGIGCLAFHSYLICREDLCDDFFSGRDLVVVDLGIHFMVSLGWISLAIFVIGIHFHAYCLHFCWKFDSLFSLCFSCLAFLVV